MANETGRDRQRSALEQSTECEPIVDTIVVGVPREILWKAFSKSHLWPEWNRCFCWVRNKALVRDDMLIWVFEPIRPIYLYRMPAWARIVELVPGERVTWEVKAVPGMYARHTYFMEDLGHGQTRFGSWEKAMGFGYRFTKRFWDAHFWFVNRESLAGARRLETLFRRDGSLERLGEIRLP